MNLALQKLLDRAKFLKRARANATAPNKPWSVGYDFKDNAQSISIPVRGNEVQRIAVFDYIPRVDAEFIAVAANETDSLTTLIELLAKQNEMLREALQAVRSQMCWERDRDQLTMGFCSLHDDVTNALAECAKIDEELGRLK